jgi:hypothetical protein
MTLMFLVNAPVCGVRLYMCMFKSACSRTRVKYYKRDNLKHSQKLQLILVYILETWKYGAILLYSESPLPHQTTNLVYFRFHTTVLMKIVHSDIIIVIYFKSRENTISEPVFYWYFT